MSERRERIEELFSAALDCAPRERAAFVEGACRGDAQLRRAVESLLGWAEGGSLVNRSRVEGLVKTMEEQEAALRVGESVGRYEVLAKTGEGGMGEVYLARDASLGRRVALKLLPTASMLSRERLRRFAQEAQAASSLNHPNIVTIYEVGEVGALHYIATEYVEGETLRERISRTGMRLGEALEISTQIAAALTAAHEAGVVHRDIKPENVMIRRDGIVKVLDFGLAKLGEQPSHLTGKGLSSVTMVDTDPGVVMGTVKYMSPEQARGQATDAGTDVFSFGVVLYEMLTGQRPFEVAMPSEVNAHVLTREPKSLAHCTGVPAELERIVHRCLEWDRQKRYQSASDLLSDLKSLKREIDSGASRAAPRGNIIQYSLLRLQSTLVVGALAAVVIVAIVYALLADRQPSLPPPEIKSVAVLPLISLDPGEDHEALGLKLTDALIQRLGRLRQIVVRQTRAVQGYEGTRLDPLAAGREQQVDAVLDGSMQRAGERLRVRARLLRTSDGQQLWAGIFDESSTDPLVLQDALAEQTAQALVPQLSGAERQLVAKRDTENVEANRLYTEGRYYWNKRNVEGIRKSLQLFEHAISLDPEYARAFAGLADAYITLSDYDLLPAKQAYPKAREAAQKALEIDDSLAEAHTARAMIKASYDWDWSGADRAFKQAIEKNPHYATAHQWYAEFLAGMGRHDEALEQIHRAQQLDPLSLIIQSSEAFILIYARDYDRAIAQCQRVISRDPNFGEVYSYLGNAYEQKGMFREAMGAYQQYSTLVGYNTREAAAIRASPVLDARDYWRKMVELAKPPTGTEFDAAQAWAQLGETDKALAMLEQARAKSSYNIMYIKVQPNLDPLRGDPRFQEVLRSVNLAQ